MGTEINLAQLTKLAQFSKEFSALSDDYIFTHIHSEAGDARARRIIDQPARIDGMTWMLCLEGSVELDVNLIPCTVGPGCLLLTPPGTIVNVRSVSEGSVDYYALFVSKDFISDINFDLNVISSMPVPTGRPEPVIRITPEECEEVRAYFGLLRSNTTGDGEEGAYSRPIARCLIAALAYRIISIVTKRLREKPADEARSSRRTTYVQKFIDLVHTHYRRERSVAFYADRLFISPKYLSMIIKEHTGRSAAQIIDGHVVLEAKNLLRFSGKNIQQVAYELNFTSQSSFGKYFKHLTGMSPTEYLKS